MNNRFTSEFERVDGEINDNSQNLLLETENRKTEDELLNRQTLSVNNDLTRYKTKNEKNIIDLRETNSNQDVLIQRAMLSIQQVQSNLTSATITATGLNSEARNQIIQAGQGNYNRTNDALSKFFDIHNFNSNPTNSKFSEKITATSESDSDLFSAWFGNYFNLNQESRSNINVGARAMFDQLDNSLTDIENLKHSNVIQSGINSDNSEKIVNIQNNFVPKFAIEENDYLSPIFSNQYGIKLESLSNTLSTMSEQLLDVTRNSTDVSTLQSNYATLVENLQDIGVTDLTTAINLNDLMESINSNKTAIEENSNLIQSSFSNFKDDNFNSNIDGTFSLTLKSNLPYYYEDITSNINMNALRDKIEVASFDDNKVWNLNDMKFDTSEGTNMYLNGTLTVPNLRNIEYGVVAGQKSNLMQKFDDIDTRINVMNKWLNSDFENDAVFNLDETLNTNETTPHALKLKDGMDFVLGDEIEPGPNIGGKSASIYVPSWSNIKRKQTYYDEPNEQEESLQEKFNTIDQQIKDNGNAINTLQLNGVTTKSLYDVLNEAPQYVHGNNTLTTKFHIKNLVTGECDSGIDACPTIDYRFTTQESRINTLSNNMSNIFETHMKNYGIEKNMYTGELVFHDTGNNGSMLKKLVAESMKLNDSLSVGTNGYFSNITTTGDISAQQVSSPNVTISNTLTLSDNNGAQIRVPGFDNIINSTTNSDLKTYLEENYLPSTLSVVSSVSYDRDNRILTFQQGTEPTLVEIPNVTSVATTQDIIDLKSKTLTRYETFRGDVGELRYFSNLQQDTTESSIKIPRKWSVIQNDGDRLQYATLSDQDDTVPSFSNFGFYDSREALIKSLSKDPEDNEQTIHVNGLKIGGICLVASSDNKKLQVCNANCQTCEDVWDKGQAPEPNVS